jgi:hypothetical protein
VPPPPSIESSYPKTLIIHPGKFIPPAPAVGVSVVVETKSNPRPSLFPSDRTELPKLTAKPINLDSEQIDLPTSDQNDLPSVVSHAIVMQPTPRFGFRRLFLASAKRAPKLELPTQKLTDQPVSQGVRAKDVVLTMAASEVPADAASRLDDDVLDLISGQVKGRLWRLRGA